MENVVMKFTARIIKLATRLLYSVVGAICWIYRTFQHGISDSLMCLNGKTAIVTGGNSGIGLMTAKLLASRGCRVIIACRRDATKEIDEIIKETNNTNIIGKYLDLCKLAVVRQFAEDIKKEETKIDILINNAGIGYSHNITTDDGLDPVMQANYLGPFLLTHLLIDLLKAAHDARIVFLTSGLSYFSDIRAKDLYPANIQTPMICIKNYWDSKLLNILIAQEMAKKLANFGIRVNAADPGTVRTPIFDTLEGSDERKVVPRRLFKTIVPLFSGSLIKAANTSFHLAASKDVGSGLSYFRCQPTWKPIILKNKDLCREIWEETEKLVKLRPEERW